MSRAHPLDAFVTRHRGLPALLVALAAGAAATYLFMFAYRHDDGALDYQDLYALAVVLTGSAATAMWLGVTAVFARLRVEPVEVGLDSPPGLGEPSQVQGLVRGTGIGLLLIAIGFIAFGWMVGSAEAYDLVVFTSIGVGVVVAAVGGGLVATASR